jgi:phasin family protein
MQQTMTDLSEGMQAMASPDEPGARVAKQAETVRRSYEHAVTNMKDLAEMIQHANADAMEVLNKRFIEAMEELRSLAQFGRIG